MRMDVKETKGVLTSVRGFFARGISVENLLIPIAALVGFSWTLGGISDNTMLVHLRTGMDIVSSWNFPDSDPYSYTARGEPWVLQSWLAEVIYGLLHSVWSTRLIILLNALMLAVIAGGMVAWVRTGSMARTAMFGFVVIMLSIGNWNTRPSTFGFFMFFLLLALIVARGRSAWWAFVVGALWVSLHGSWPLGLIWLALAIVGAWIDTRQLPSFEFRRLIAFASGVVLLGLVNPASWKVLVFPVIALEKSAIFENIMEWRSPNFHSGPFLSSEGVLISLTLTLVFLVWLRPSWRHSLPVIGFVVLSLYSQRNLPFLAIGLASVLAPAWHARATVLPGSTTQMFTKWGLVEVFASVVLVASFVVQVVRVGTIEPYKFSTYPVDGLAYAESRGYFDDGRHVLAPDVVGCLLIFQRGQSANVFIDDRYDMYPMKFSEDALDILRVRGEVQEQLDKYDVDAILWEREKPLSSYLSVNEEWRQDWSNADWVFFVRN